MGEDIGIGMTQKAQLKGDLHTPQHQGPAGNQAVHIKTKTNQGVFRRGQIFGGGHFDVGVFTRDNMHRLPQRLHQSAVVSGLKALLPCLLVGPEDQLIAEKLRRLHRPQLCTGRRVHNPPLPHPLNGVFYRYGQTHRQMPAHGGKAPADQLRSDKGPRPVVDDHPVGIPRQGLKPQEHAFLPGLASGYHLHGPARDDPRS